MNPSPGYVSGVGKYAEKDSVIVEILYACGAVPFVRTNVPQTLMVINVDSSDFVRLVDDISIVGRNLQPRLWTYPESIQSILDAGGILRWRRRINYHER